ncbi:MAG: hypothetical protein LUC85_01325 [Bacteroidales bacterium]|nr:hypothetical protein [Bacteroidales bacterium]
MYPHANLNNDSMRLIENILVNAKRHPMYRGYDIDLNFSAGYGAGAIGIDVTRDGQPVNLFLFYPAWGSGKIESVAIYGSQLAGHKRAIEGSMTIFGLPVEDVEWDQGIERFLDVTLQDY